VICPTSPGAAGAERGFSSMTACYVALSNDLVPLMSIDEMDFAVTNPTCGG
jgi:hypothetical protein